MTGMNIQDRYDDIARLSGLSEGVIRRVLKASRQSLVQSLKQGERATLPGICTFVPEIGNRINRNRLDIEEEGVTKFIRIKSSASSALETELEKLSKFESTDEKEQAEVDGLMKLRVDDKNTDFHSYRQSRQSGIRTNQISALL